MRMTKDRVRVVIGCVLAVVLIAPLVYFWQASRLPSTYSVMDMGYVDYGGGPHGMAGMSGMSGHDMSGHDGSMVSVKDLVENPNRKADKVVTSWPARARSSWPTGSWSTATRSTARRPARSSRSRRASCSRCTCATRTSTTASPCTGTALDVPERRGRCRRRHAGRGDARQGVDLPVRGATGGHLLVPLPPGLPRAGDPWSARPARGASAQGRRTGPGRGRRLAHVRRHRLAQRPQAGAGRGAARATGAAPADQHRQRPDQGVGERAVPGARDRRARREQADGRHRPGRDAHRGWPARRRGGGTEGRFRHPGAGGSGHRARGRERHGARQDAASSDEGARPAVLRLAGAARVRPVEGRPALRLLDRSPARASSAASPACGGRSTVTCGRTCRCSWCTRATS